MPAWVDGAPKMFLPGLQAPVAAVPQHPYATTKVPSGNVLATFAVTESLPVLVSE